MERLRSQAALAAFLSELGEAVEQAELVYMPVYIASSIANTVLSILAWS